MIILVFGVWFFIYYFLEMKLEFFGERVDFRFELENVYNEIRIVYFVWK